MSTFGGLYVGGAGIKSSQNALNTTAHNLVNVNTTGYTRQQVYMAEMSPNTVGASAISMMQAGLGASYDEARQIRDVFLDKSYRTESGRQAFYDTQYSSVSELEVYLGEMEGVSFQNSLLELYRAAEEWDKIPDDPNNLDLVILKSVELLERAGSVYDGLKGYQQDINEKISNQIDELNKIGKQISELNHEILKIEAAGVEKANDLRDDRNLLIDQLSSYGYVEVNQMYDGLLEIKFEGEFFVVRSGCNEMAGYTDNLTGFVTPVWPELVVNNEPVMNHQVYDFTHAIDSEKNTDIGSLKSLILSRGMDYADYTDMEGLSSEDYRTGLQTRTIMNAEAELDRMMHSLVTRMNDLLSPTVELTDDSGRTFKVWDEANSAIGIGQEGPSEEMFVRKNLSRYREMFLTVGGETQKYYVYNEEDMSDTDTLYSIDSLEINPKLLENENLLPHRRANGEVDSGMTSKMVELFNEKLINLNPNDETKLSIMDFYQSMVNLFGNEGSTYKSKAETLAVTVNAVSNKRQQVVGVSSDEELGNMIKFQNAYNASSRYINVVNEMIEHLLTNLG